MGGAAASASTVRAMSLICATPLASKIVLFRFSAGVFRGGREGLRLSNCVGPRKCALWGIVERRKEQSNRLNWTWRQQQQQPSCTLQTSGNTAGRNEGGSRGQIRIPVLDRDENGNIFLREFPGDENFQPSENGSPSSSKTSSRPARKANGVKETKSVNGKSPSPGPLRSVKVNLPPTDPRARRLASSAKVASNKKSPLYSKAARRFYNEKFRAEPQRLSKVLAAAGGLIPSLFPSLLHLSMSPSLKSLVCGLTQPEDH